MIVAIDGIIKSKNDTNIYIKTNNGLTYEVFLNANLIRNLELNSPIELFIKHIIREDAQILYGFKHQNEKEMFLKITKINGIGPKVAMAICSTFSVSEFMNIVLKKDANALSKTPGIGIKSATKILNSLVDFNIESNLYEKTNTKDMSLVYDALISLGFRKNDINIALNECDLNKEVNEIVKNALQKLK